ncbi:hypothetical protein INR49_027308 [Caranx melampygus]|nr:hypothetical protein INR49_027308 [Caranx melampygus]
MTSASEGWGQRSGPGSSCSVRALPVGGACSLPDPQMGGGTRALLLQQTGAHPRSAFSPHRVTFLLSRFHRTRARTSRPGTTTRAEPTEGPRGSGTSNRSSDGVPYKPEYVAAARISTHPLTSLDEHQIPCSPSDLKCN